MIMSKYQFKHPKVFVGQPDCSIGQYTMPDRTIMLGNWTRDWLMFYRVYNESYFHMVVRVLDHEYLHALLHDFINWNACNDLDNLYQAGAIFWKLPF